MAVRLSKGQAEVAAIELGLHEEHLRAMAEEMDEVPGELAVRILNTRNLHALLIDLIAEEEKE